MKTYIQPQTTAFELCMAEYILAVSTQDNGATVSISKGTGTVGDPSAIWSRGKESTSSGMWEDMK